MSFKKFLPSSPSFLLLVLSSRLIQLKKPSFSRLQSNSPGGHIHGGRNSTTDFTGLSAADSLEGEYSSILALMFGVRGAAIGPCSCVARRAGRLGYFKRTEILARE